MLRIPVEKTEFHRETAAGKPLTVGEIRVHPVVNILHQLSDMVTKTPTLQLESKSILAPQIPLT